ncbi:unnamed protein product [Rotaria magnacalcarata]|uniref:RING-type domain-containing protein n=6 Tax=Rotaria magnacalcarata TaxID=392030 RepID=A0A814GA89_9BILA|nr:unnamed protein product [Rotaria magnacalcarata]
MLRRYRHAPYVRLTEAPGEHAPHINLTHVNGDIHVQLKKKIQSGEERTLLLTPEQFFQISDKIDEIRQAGHIMADYHGHQSETKPPDTSGSFKFILRSDFESHKREHMYEWEMPTSPLRVSVRNRRSDGKRPIATQFVVEVRIFTASGRPTNDGIMMAWHNFHGTFVQHRRERQTRIQQMRTNDLSTTPEASRASDSTAPIAIPIASVTNKQNLPSWTIDDKYVNKEDYSCVICMDTYVKGECVHGLPRCSHYFHSKCIEAWLVGSNDCPVCRSKV